MSNYQCKCGGLIFPDFEAFKVGDEVNFIQQKTKDIGKGLFSISQKACTGFITKIKGDDIQVQSNKKLYDLYRFGITPKDAPGPIEYRRIGKCRCALDQQIKIGE
jgi:hypothetical protein